MPDEDPEVVATLWLPNVKGDRAVMVYGRSGKYPFKPSPRHDRKLVREYTDVATFEREELDIRQNTRNTIPVCTLVGSPDPINRAAEAIQNLINAGLKVPSGRRLSALLALAATIGSEVDKLKEQGVEPVDSIAEPEPPVPIIPNDLKEDEIEEVPPPVLADAPPPPDVPPAITAAPPEPGKIYTEAELMQMPFEQERRLGKELGSQLRNPSRKELTADILRLQAAPSQGA